MALHRDERVVFGLLYMWLRDGKLPLTSKTARYVGQHYRSLLGDDEVCFSSEEIVVFIRENRFAQHIVRRLRQLSHSRRSGRMRPRARVVSLDNDDQFVVK